MPLADPLGIIGGAPTADPLGIIGGSSAPSASSQPPKRYDEQSLRDLWTKAGGSSDEAGLMAQVALAESSGDPDAKNQYVQDGKTYHVHGLWQISDINGAGNYGDPLTNAKKAVELYKQSGLSPWDASRPKWEKYLSSHAPGTAEADSRNRDFHSDPLGIIKTPPPDPLAGVKSAVGNAIAPVASHVSDAFTTAIDYASAPVAPAAALARDLYYQAQQRKKLSGKALEDWNARVAAAKNSRNPDDLKETQPNMYALLKAQQDGGLKPDKIHALSQMTTLFGEGKGSFSDLLPDGSLGTGEAKKPPQIDESSSGFFSGGKTPKKEPAAQVKPLLEAGGDMALQAVNPLNLIDAPLSAMAAGVRDGVMGSKTMARAIEAAKKTDVGSQVFNAITDVKSQVNPVHRIRVAAQNQGLDPDVAVNHVYTFLNAPRVAEANGQKIVDEVFPRDLTPAQRFEAWRLAHPSSEPRLEDPDGKIRTAADKLRSVYTQATDEQRALGLLDDSEVFNTQNYTYMKGQDIYKSEKKELPAQVREFFAAEMARYMKKNIGADTAKHHKLYMDADEAEPFLDKEKFDPADQLLLYLTKRGTDVGRENALRELHDMGLIKNLAVFDPKDMTSVIGEGKEGADAAARVGQRQGQYHAAQEAFESLNAMRVRRGDYPLTWNDFAQMQQAVKDAKRLRPRMQEADRAARTTTGMADRAQKGADIVRQRIGDQLNAELNKRSRLLETFNQKIDRLHAMAQNGDRAAAAKSLAAAVAGRDKAALEIDAIKEKIQRQAEDVYGRRGPESKKDGTEEYYAAVEKYGVDSPEAEAAFKAAKYTEPVQPTDIYKPVVGRIQEIYELAKQLPPGQQRGDVLRALGALGKRGVKGPQQIADRMGAEKMLRNVQRTMSRVAEAGRDQTSMRIVAELEKVSQRLEAGIAKDSDKLYATRNKVADPAQRAANAVFMGNQKALARFHAIADRYDFARQSYNDVAAFESAFKRAMRIRGKRIGKGIVEKSQVKTALDEGLVPFVHGKRDDSMGSPTLKFAVADPQVVKFFQTQGAPRPAATGIASMFAGMNKLAQMGIITNPVVHAGWNLGTHFLAAGGSPTFFTDHAWRDPEEWGKLGSKTGAEWTHMADQYNAIVHAADTHPLFGGSYAKNFIDKPGEHGVWHGLNAGMSQLWAMNQRLVFEQFERRYSVALFAHFVDHMGMTPEEAGLKVRAALGDYTNISRGGVEGALNHAIMFYGWMKSAIPFWAKTLVTKPQFISIPGVGIRRWDEDMGDPDMGHENPFTIDKGPSATTPGVHDKLSFPGPQKWVGDLLNIIMPRNHDVDEIGSRVDAAESILADRIKPFGPIAGGATLAATYMPGVKAQQPGGSNRLIIANRDDRAPAQVGEAARSLANTLPGVELGTGIAQSAGAIAHGDVRSLAGVTGGFQYTPTSKAARMQLGAAQAARDRSLARAKNVTNPKVRTRMIESAQDAYDRVVKRVERQHPAPLKATAPVPLADPLGIINNYGPSDPLAGR